MRLWFAAVVAGAVVLVGCGSVRQGTSVGSRSSAVASSDQSGSARSTSTPASDRASATTGASVTGTASAAGGAARPPRAAATGLFSPAAVETTVRRAAASCVDLTGDRVVQLPARQAALPAPLPAAQGALIVARRTYARLRRSPAGGALHQQLLSTAQARVDALLSINYALERHDRTALAIAGGTLKVITLRLQDLGRRSGARAC